MKEIGIHVMININKMKNEKIKNIIIELLQDSLTGKLDSSSNFNPQFLADAIIKKTELAKTYAEIKAKDIDDTMSIFEGWIEDIDKDMDNELEQLGEDEKLLKNFIRGQKTACEKLKEKIECNEI